MPRAHVVLRCVQPTCHVHAARYTLLSFATCCLNGTSLTYYVRSLLHRSFCRHQILCATGRGTFTAAVEVRNQQQMCLSFLYHLALQRNIRNPLEVELCRACSITHP